MSETKENRGNFILLLPLRSVSENETRKAANYLNLIMSWKDIGKTFSNRILLLFQAVVFLRYPVYIYIKKKKLNRREWKRENT